MPKKYQLHSKVSKQGDDLLIRIPDRAKAKFQPLHRIPLRIILEVLEDGEIKEESGK